MLSRPVAAPVWLKLAVDAAGLRVHVVGEVVEVRVLQLHQAAVLEDQLRHRVLVGELLEHFDVGARAGLGAA